MRRKRSAEAEEKKAEALKAEVVWAAADEEESRRVVRSALRIVILRMREKEREEPV